MKKVLLSSFIAFCLFFLFVACATTSVADLGLVRNNSPLIQRFMPVFIMPESDISAGNGIEAVFFKEHKTEAGISVEITVIFYDEDHPNALTDGLYDFYRSFRYRRVRDVETFFFYLNPEGTEILYADFPGTYAEDQRFYEKKVKHYSAEIPGTSFKYAEGRPVIHVTTWNHMFREMATEPKLETVPVSDYPVYTGSREEVERFIAR